MKPKTKNEITAETIIRTALAMIDKGGLSAFSIRKVASELEVYPTAVLWHVGSRDRLLGMIVHHVMNPSSMKEHKGPWRDRLQAIAADYRQAVRNHPAIAPLLGADLTSNAGVSLEFIESILAAFADAGVATDRLVESYNAFAGAVIGFVTLELSPEPDDGVQDLREQLTQSLEGASPDRFPLTSSLKDQLADKAFVTRWTSGASAPMDKAFNHMVASLINGLVPSPKGNEPGA